MTGPLEVSRRHVLQLLGITSAGVMGAGALAACSPGKPEDNKSTGTSSNSAGGGDAKGGEFHIGWPYTAPPEGNYNYFSTSNIIESGAYGDLFRVPSATYLWADKQWYNLLIESSKMAEDGKTYEVKLKKDLKWSDGSALTAKDYVTSFNCAWLLSQPAWKYVTSVEAKDDTTFVLNLKQPSTVLERYILKLRIVDSATFGAIAEKADAFIKGGKTTDDPEVAKLLEELQKLKPEAPLSSGPFKLDTGSASNTQIAAVKNENSVFAKDVKFDKIVFYNGETPEVTPLVQSKTVDYATHGFPPSTEKAFQNVGVRILRPPNLSGPAVLINFQKCPEFADKKVRKALAHAIDRNVNGAVSLADSGKGVEYMAGFADGQLDEWLPSGVKDKLVKYEHDTGKAEALLKEAGWTKDGDTWKTKDGKEAKYEITFPAEYADWSAAGKNVAEQLSSFGIKVTPRGVNWAQQPIDIDKGNFQMAINAWGASSHPHPYFAFQQDLLTHNIPIAKNNGGKGMAYELGAVPGPDGKTVNLEDQITAAGAGLDVEKQKEAIGVLAQVFNEELPMLPLFERYGNNACLEGTRVKAFPKDDDPILKNPVYADNFVVIKLFKGEIEPV